MSRVERFIERLVERPSARLFRTRLQPIQVLRRIERAMEAGRDAGGTRGLVPDRFTVRLHPDDLATLQPADAVASELASGALTFARAHRYALRDRPQVTLQPDPTRRPGDAEVDAEVSRMAGPAVADDHIDGGTRVFEVPVVRSPEVVIEIREPNRAARRIPVTGAPMRIGRAAECEVVLKDSRASRRHARLHARDGVLVLTDLGSTNGTRVNGHRVTELVLGAGDRIQIGDTHLVVEAAPAGTAARA
jgi:FhaA, N-terminal domain/FHA domain